MEEDRTSQIKKLRKLYKNFEDSEKLINLLIENFTILEIDDIINKSK